MNRQLKFTLAGRIVTRSKTARAIWLEALRTDKKWLIPQARSVQFQLRAAGQ